MYSFTSSVWKYLLQLHPQLPPHDQSAGPEKDKMAKTKNSGDKQ